MLEEIGFVWNVHNFKWNQRYEELEMFNEINGHCDVPLNKGTNALYRWRRRQISEYEKLQEGKQSTLTKGRIEKLRKIGLIR